ncbi:hypothetical protein V7127_04270 [Bacillus sp. JJ1773]
MQLSSQGVTDYKNIFLAEWLEGDGLFIQSMIPPNLSTQQAR